MSSPSREMPEEVAQLLTKIDDIDDSLLHFAMINTTTGANESGKTLALLLEALGITESPLDFAPAKLKERIKEKLELKNGPEIITLVEGLDNAIWTDRMQRASLDNGIVT